MDSEKEYSFSSDAECSDEENSISTERELQSTTLEDKNKNEKKFTYEVLTPDQIVQNMNAAVNEVNNIFGISPTQLRTLLDNFKWDVDKLYESYNGGEQSKLFEEAQIGNNPARTEDIEYCDICCDQISTSRMTGLACGHRYCQECWETYLTSKIMEEGIGQIRCGGSNCDILMDDQTVMNLITDPKVKQRYQLLITKNYVECNRLLQVCPSPDCNNVIKVQYVSPQPVTCKCAHTFCFSCSENWHAPIECDLMRKWQKKRDEDTETNNWIVANTKKCPKCNVNVEKDGGCCHMSCRNRKCGYQFCWVCLGPWKLHKSDYKCKKLENATILESREKCKAVLERYLFHLDRYMNHMQSMKLENKLHAAVEEKMEEMQNQGMSWVEAQFLKKIVDVLGQCRQTLMYTYVLTFFIKKTNQAVIFEAHQGELQSATEKLSEYLEQDMAKEDVSQIRGKIQENYIYCENLRKVLLKYVQEGYEKKWWEYIE